MWDGAIQNQGKAKGQEVISKKTDPAQRGKGKVRGVSEERVHRPGGKVRMVTRAEKRSGGGKNKREKTPERKEPCARGGDWGGDGPQTKKKFHDGVGGRLSAKSGRKKVESTQKH